ncbi:MAG: MFS transporter, partial [Solimonas sp.]
MLLLGSANSVLFAVTPPAGRQLGLAEWQIGLIVTFSAAAYMVFAAIWGHVSDLKGRRYVLTLGMLGFGLGGLVFAITLDLGLAGIVSAPLALALLIAVRMLQSLVSAGAFPAAQAHIAENAPPERRAVALSAMTSAFALGNVLGPAIAGVLVMVWITLPLYAIAGIIAVLFQLLVIRRSGWSARTLMAVGLAAAAVAQVGLMTADRQWQFLLVALPLGISFTCVSPGFSAAVSLAAGATEQGAAAGLVATAQASGFLIGPVLFAGIYQISTGMLFMVGLTIALVLLAL